MAVVITWTLIPCKKNATDFSNSQLSELSSLLLFTEQSQRQIDEYCDLFISMSYVSSCDDCFSHNTWKFWISRTIDNDMTYYDGMCPGMEPQLVDIEGNYKN